MLFIDSLSQSVIIMTALILLGVALRRVGLLREDHSQLFSRLLMDVTLPALIFRAFSGTQMRSDQLGLAGIMIGAEAASALLAWVAGRILRLTPPRMGALILASTFSSSAFFGYAIIKNIFPDNMAALSEAAIVSEIGVAFTLFTAGVWIAIHFGTAKVSRKERIKMMVGFFRSPVFIAMASGFIISRLGWPQDNIVCQTAGKILDTVAAANTLMVGLTVGTMLHFRDFRQIFVVVLMGCFIKLIFQPAVASFAMRPLDLPVIWQQVMVIEAAMPSAAMAAVFAKRFGCDHELTTILVFTTFASSLFTVVSITFFLFGLS